MLHLQRCINVTFTDTTNSFALRAADFFFGGGMRQTAEVLQLLSEFELPTLAMVIDEVRIIFAPV